MQNNHEQYMRRCIELAKKAKGNTYPNPLVGSIIVYDGKIIGEGYHKKAGEAHAEINAINSVKNQELLKDSKIYVTLEPCSHYGKTPPCALKIKDIGFKKVIIGAMDSHEKVNGKGKKILEDSGIEVISGVLEKECIELNKRFFTFHKKKRPYIILKWAESNDGFLDKNFQPTAISNSIANQYVHQLRADENAILVGTKTALNDNPSLTVRNVNGNNPIRILIDFDLKIPEDFNIYNNEAPTLVFNFIKNDKRENVKWIKIERKKILKNILQKLYKEQIQSVVIEGGSFTIQQFLDENIWDKIIVIKNPNLSLEHGTPAPKFERTPFLERKIGDNLLSLYYQH